MLAAFSWLLVLFPRCFDLLPRLAAAVKTPVFRASESLP